MVTTLLEHWFFMFYQKQKKKFNLFHSTFLHVLCITIISGLTMYLHCVAVYENGRRYVNLAWLDKTGGHSTDDVNWFLVHRIRIRRMQPLISILFPVHFYWFVLRADGAESPHALYLNYKILIYSFG